MKLQFLVAIVALLVTVIAAAEETADNCIQGMASISPEFSNQVTSDSSALFVYIRETDRASGIPTAVITIDNPRYPQSFTLCGADQMMGNVEAKTLDGKYKLFARHSPTGTPMKKEGFIGESLGLGGKGIKVGDKVTVIINKVYTE